MFCWLCVYLLTYLQYARTLCEVDVFALAVHAWIVLRLVICGSTGTDLRRFHCILFLFLFFSSFALLLRFGHQSPYILTFVRLRIQYSSFTRSFFYFVSSWRSVFFFFCLFRRSHSVGTHACTNTILDTKQIHRCVASFIAVVALASRWSLFFYGLFCGEPFLSCRGRIKHMWIMSQLPMYILVNLYKHRTVWLKLMPSKL